MARQDALSGLSAEKALAGVLALIAADREDQLGDKDPRKNEIVLASVGFNAREIAVILGKKPDAVTKTLQRARKQ
jgi:DNA-directed RNA polymerase specialized sigma24 family protein